MKTRLAKMGEILRDRGLTMEVYTDRSAEGTHIIRAAHGPTEAGVLRSGHLATLSH